MSVSSISASSKTNFKTSSFVGVSATAPFKKILRNYVQMSVEIVPVRNMHISQLAKFAHQGQTNQTNEEVNVIPIEEEDDATYVDLFNFLNNNPSPKPGTHVIEST